MKKKILAFITAFVLAFNLTACGNKSVLHIKVTGIGDYKVVEYPEDVVNYSHDDNDIIITVKENKDYNFVVQDEDGKQYSFTIIYKDKTAEAQTNDNIAIELGIE